MSCDSPHNQRWIGLQRFTLPMLAEGPKTGSVDSLRVPESSINKWLVAKGSSFGGAATQASRSGQNPLMPFRMARFPSNGRPTPSTTIRVRRRNASLHESRRRICSSWQHEIKKLPAPPPQQQQSRLRPVKMLNLPLIFLPGQPIASPYGRNLGIGIFGLSR